MRQSGRLGFAALVVLPFVVAVGCGGGSGSEGKGLDGVYQMQTRYGDDSEPQAGPENYGDWTFVLDGGRFAFTQEYRDACTWGYGNLTFKGDEMDWTFTEGGGYAPTGGMNKAGEHFRFRWSLYHDTLTLSPVEGTDLSVNDVSPMNFRAKPWHLVSGTPSRRYFAKKCPPPREALP